MEVLGDPPTARDLVRDRDSWGADLLVWLPDQRAFAAYDGDHAEMTIFCDTTWSDITADPGGYLNAMWSSPLFYQGRPVPGEPFHPPVTSGR